MKKVMMLCKNSFKKNFKHILSFSIILLIATVLFSSAMVIKGSIDGDYDAKHESLNTANMFFTVPKFQYADDTLDKIKSTEGVDEAQERCGIMLTVPVEMNDAVQEQTQIFYKIDDTASISRYNIITEISEGDIYIPYYVYINSAMEPGDKLEFKSGDKKHAFVIKGVVEEMQYGNYSSSVIGNYVTDDTYARLKAGCEDKEVVTLSVKAQDSYAVYNRVSKLLTKENIMVLSKNYDEASKQARLAVSNILVLLILAFSVVMLLISILVSKFKIKSSIEEELTNMGVLKALGYSGRQIIAGVVLPFIIAGVITTVIGIALSYLVIPLLAGVISSQAGFEWLPGFDLTSGIITAVINIVLVSFFCFTSARKIKKLDPINAIRGIENTKGGKNHFRIDRTKGGINFILALKNFANAKSQNILLGIVVFFITILASFVAVLFYNVNVNPMNFVNTLVEEHPTVVIVSTDKDIKDELAAETGVSKAVYYDENLAVNIEGDSFKTFVSESYEGLANDLCYEGVNPAAADEVAVGSFIREQFGYNVGDEITLGKGENSKQYKITGFIQSVNYSGQVTELTNEGYQCLESDYEPSCVYVYLDNEDAAADFIKTAEDKYGDRISSTVNYAESMSSAVDMFVSLISAVTVIIMIISVVVIFLILYILISEVIAKRKQELGILKSVGYVNRQLVWQIVGGFMSGTVIAAALGAVVNKLFIDKAFGFIFKMVGSYKVSFEYPLFIFVLIAVALVVSTVILGVLLAKKIKNISVYSLIKE